MSHPPKPLGSSLVPSASLVLLSFSLHLPLSCLGRRALCFGEGSFLPTQPLCAAKMSSSPLRGVLAVAIEIPAFAQSQRSQTSMQAGAASPTWGLQVPLIESQTLVCVTQKPRALWGDGRRAKPEGKASRSGSENGEMTKVSPKMLWCLYRACRK